MPNCELTTQSQILSYLQSVSLIGDYRTHSAWEAQGLEFVDTTVVPAIEDVYRDFQPLWQFYLTPKHFKKGNMTVEAGVFLRNYLWKLYKTFYFYLTMPKGEGEKKGKKEKYERFQEVMDTFVARMVNEAQFHGGERPDAVDFRVYSWIHRYYHTSTMKSLLQARGGKDDKLVIWFDRMDRATKNKTNL
jgi:hypothetical protein